MPRIWIDNDDQRKHDMENDHRTKMGQPTIEEEQEQAHRELLKNLKRPKAWQMRKKQGEGLWQADIGE